MPRKPNEEGAKLAPLNIRTTQDRRQRLEAAAEASGRSLTQQVERYLDMAMDIEARLGGELLFDAISQIGGAAALALKSGGGDLSDYRTRARVISAIANAAEWAVPAPDLFAKGDLGELAHHINQLQNVLPIIMPEYQPGYFDNMRWGVPLPPAIYDNAMSAIIEAENRLHNDANSLTVLATTKSSLQQAQTRAVMISGEASQHREIGRLDALRMYGQLTQTSDL